MVNGQCLKDSWYLDVSLVAEGSGDLEHGRKIKDPPSTMAPTLLSHAYTSWYVGYIYIYMHQSERWNTILWSTSPPKCEAQTARMAMSISETLQRLQATKVSNRSGGATGSKGPKTADLEVRHYVPLGDNSGCWLLEWHPSHHFFLWICFFFGGGWFEWMVMTQNMEHKFRWFQAD